MPKAPLPFAKPARQALRINRSFMSASFAIPHFCGGSFQEQSYFREPMWLRDCT
jgi:hypothetical protein